MIQYSNAIFKKLQHDLMELSNHEVITLRTYKNDRGFCIEKIAQDCFYLKEDGYFVKENTNLNLHDLLKLLNRNFAREFPRSHKIRYVHSRKT